MKKFVNFSSKTFEKHLPTGYLQEMPNCHPTENSFLFGVQTSTLPSCQNFAQ